MSAVLSTNKQTLYEKIGGDIGVHYMMEQLLTDSAEDPSFLEFFKGASISSLLNHQIRFFRLVLGPEEDKPDTKVLINHLLLAHSRLFRDAGLNEKHFDIVVTSFAKGLQGMHIDQDVIDECAACLVPLRAVFAYGATVAKNQKHANDSSRIYPTASAETMQHGQVQAVRLEEAPTLEIPSWLQHSIKKLSKEISLRSWTAALSDAFGEEGDQLIADTFLAMPYLYHHPYLLAVLHLAFRPDNQKENLQHCIKIVKYPRGETKEAVCLQLWIRMVEAFSRVCRSDNMKMKSQKGIDITYANLMYYSGQFPDKSYVMVGGLKGPHLLSGIPTHYELPDDKPTTSSIRSTSKKKKALGLSPAKPFASSSKKHDGDSVVGKAIVQLLGCRGLATARPSET